MGGLAGKGRKVPSFEQAGTLKNKNSNININNDINNDNKNNVDIKNNENSDIKSIVAKAINKVEKPKKVNVSFYIDSDVNEAVKQFGKNNGKGSQSELVNELLRSALNVK